MIKKDLGHQLEITNEEVKQAQVRNQTNMAAFNELKYVMFSVTVNIKILIEKRMKDFKCSS